MGRPDAYLRGVLADRLVLIKWVFSKRSDTERLRGVDSASVYRQLYPPGTAGSDWNYQDVVYRSFMLFILETGADAFSAAGFHRM